MIKFRVWDKENERMLVPGEDSDCITLEIDENGINVYDMQHPSAEKGYDLAHLDCELMQSTGVTSIYDDNNTEIYEGDIVKTKSSPRGRFIGCVGNAVSRFEVRGVKQYKGLKYDLDGSYVVIGNVHQNPELLEGE